jgi:hypothetical protein
MLIVALEALNALTCQLLTVEWKEKNDLKEQVQQLQQQVLASEKSREDERISREKQDAAAEKVRCARPSIFVQCELDKDMIGELRTKCEGLEDEVTQLKKALAEADKVRCVVIVNISTSVCIKWMKIVILLSIMCCENG